MSKTLSRSQVAKLIFQMSRACKLLEQSLKEPIIRREQAKNTYKAIFSQTVWQELDQMPIGRIKDVTKGNLRIGIVENNGYKTVGDIAKADIRSISAIHGVGKTTAAQLISAATELKYSFEKEIRIRLNPYDNNPLQTRLIEQLIDYGVAKKIIEPVESDLNEFIRKINALIVLAKTNSSWLKMLFSSKNKKIASEKAVEQLATLIDSSFLVGTLNIINKMNERKRLSESDLWKTYEMHAAYYNGLLIDIGELEPETEASQGHLIPEIAIKVQNHPLNLERMKTSLRGYQAFGSKFLLQQKRVIIGDEMGLGKTLQGLAAMSHLYHEDKQSRFLVVCPASVIENWIREAGIHTTIPVTSLYGISRIDGSQVWTRQGGIGITTFDGLKVLPSKLEMPFKMLIVDEAHYIKNPKTQRAQVVVKWRTLAEYVLFLTGTPMENNVIEFNTLVSYLNPEIYDKLNSIYSGNNLITRASQFRKIVAPLYLRREQKDVLKELPARIETNEWINMDNDSLRAYKEAVATGNFMAMRQAAFTSIHSSKMQRLVEIVDEAVSNNHKVVVFSFFRKVLQLVHIRFDKNAVGPITGGVSPKDRQAMVDKLTHDKSASVLLCQINAGGVGLNIQAASVVILAEPQWKPSIENQAIARCHRMGQIRTVNVYRLLTQDGVDQRMIEILKNKSNLFNEYARQSEIKDQSPGAVDISDLREIEKTAKESLAEREIIESERRRLHLLPH